MKKSIVAVAVLLGTSSVFAQDLENKMGERYLPQAEDWAIGIDATPFLNYFGNLIGGNDGNVAPTWNYLTTNQTITGKYFAADDMAYRASFRLGFASNSQKAMVDDRSDDNTPGLTNPWPDMPSQVENKMKSGSFNFGLSVGLEKRRGFGRLQGFYGAELGIMLGSSSEKYEYGNALVASVNAGDQGNVDVAGADDWGSSVLLGGSNLIGTSDGLGNAQTGRATEVKSGMMFGIGLRGFIGAEYFILPRIALGGEFGWGLTFINNGASSTTYEVEGHTAGQTVGTDATSVNTITVEGSKSSGFGIDTDAVNSVFGPAGSLRMTFHF